MVDTEQVRLQKFLAAQGVASRRQVEAMIVDGAIRVNGTIATLGTKVDPARDRVTVRGRAAVSRTTGPVTLLVNKPRGLICSHSDPHHTRTIYNLIPPPWNRQRLLCAGRLDKESDGMVILTSDGDLMQRLTHPAHRVVKRYLVTLSRPFQPAHRNLILDGIVDDDERLRAEKIVPVKRGRNAECSLEVHLEHGRKREIRRLFEHFGYFVERLHRFQIGSLQLRGVGPGRVRALSRAEIERLFENPS